MTEGNGHGNAAQCRGCGALIVREDDSPPELPPGYRPPPDVKMVIVELCDECGADFLAWLRENEPKRFE